MTHLVTIAPAQLDQGAQLSAAADPNVDQAGAKFTRILGTAMPIGAPSNPSSDGYRYQFSKGPANADELVDVVIEHDEWLDPIGRLAEPLSPADDGARLAATARIFDTQAGRDALVLAAEGVKGGFSVSASFESFTEDEDGVRHVDDWLLRHVGVVRHPAFSESLGLTLAASAQAAAPTQEGTPMPPESLTIEQLPTVAELAAQVAEALREQDTAPTHPLAQFAQASDYFAEFQASTAAEQAELSTAFAVGIQVTGNNPGVMEPTWITEIKANIDARRPGIQAFGGATGLPDSGMDVSWPYFDGDLDALIAKQVAELDPLTGVRIDIKKATEPILTAGVASTISWQLILRSSPAYMAAHQAITQAAWARYTEAEFELALAAAGVEAVGALPAIAADAKPTAYKRQLFAASAAVEDATGAPANVVLVSSDVFLELGGADLPNPNYGNGNGVGTANAATLAIDVAGMVHTRAPFLPAGTVVVSNDKAAKFAESGPLVATQEQVQKLGTDVSTWGMYVPVQAYFPAGVVRLDRAA